jgi:hypothetical protein
MKLPLPGASPTNGVNSPQFGFFCIKASRGRTIKLFFMDNMQTIIQPTDRRAICPDPAALSPAAA